MNAWDTLVEQIVESLKRYSPGTIGAVLKVEPFQYQDTYAANVAAFDIAPAATGVVYVLKFVEWYCPVNTATGAPQLNIYTWPGAVSKTHIMTLATANTRRMFQDVICSRVAHAPNGATAGTLNLVVTGYKITYQ